MDEFDYTFFIFAGAELDLSVVASDANQAYFKDGREIRVFGNRAGMASLANILLSFHGNANDREYIPISGLPFVRVLDNTSLSIRLTAADGNKECGKIACSDGASQFEWQLPDECLLQLAVNVIHRLAADPLHEYELAPNSPEGDAIVHFRLTDAREFLS